MNNVPAGLIVLIVLVIFAVIVIVRTIKIVPQQTSLIIERLGRYSRTLNAGIHFLVPFVDKVRANIDLREQVVSFPPQPVITSDNLVVSIDTVIYYAVMDAKSAVYEIANFIQGIEQLTVTTLRNVIGSLDLEQTLTSRDQINGQLRGVLDEATGRWGIRVGRVELKAIDPPHSVQDSMEKQMRAERDRRATILTAEGIKQSAILTAEGEKQSQILRAEGGAQARILEAEGQSRAIKQVFDAIHRGKPTQRLLAYQYLQVLPQLARGDSNKMWIIPSELTEALKGIGGAFGAKDSGKYDGPEDDEQWVDDGTETPSPFDDTALEDPVKALEEARAQARGATAEAEQHAQPVGRQPHHDTQQWSPANDAPATPLMPREAPSTDDAHPAGSGELPPAPGQHGQQDQQAPAPGQPGEQPPAPGHPGEQPPAPGRPGSGQN